MGGRPALVLNDPNVIREVLETRPADFYKAAPGRALDPLITKNSVFTSNPPEWVALRESNPLNMANFDRWVAQLAAPLGEVVSHWSQRLQSTSRTSDVYQPLEQMTFDMFSVAFWGRVLPSQFYHDFLAMAKTGTRRMMIEGAGFPLAPSIWPLFLFARRRWYCRFDAIVTEARNDGVPRGHDLLSTVLRAGTPLDGLPLVESIATNYFGGGFSCPSAICAVLYLLAGRPDITERLRQELKGMENGFTLEQLNQCTLLDYVVREALRLLTPVPMFFRNSSATRTVRLAGCELPPDTLLMICNWHLHRSADHWEKPHEFNPDRWANGATESDPLGSDWFFPFGRGPRTCIGMNFAMFSIRLTLATLLSRLRIRIDPNQPYTQNYFFAVMMPKGLKAEFSSA
jgi:cytochrome P450